MSGNEVRNPGVKAADLAAAVTDPRQLALERPEVPKPKLLIESLRFVGQSKLTLADGKLYELLLTLARQQGVEKPEYQARVGDLASFVNEGHLDRIKASLRRIASTIVTYDYTVDDGQVRHWGTMPLILYRGIDDLRTGASKLAYQFPHAVCEALLDGGSYALLDLEEIASFRCRYTFRLYELLSLIAGYDDQFRKPWAIAPEDLAAMLGYAPKVWNYAIFKRDVLNPVMADIKEHVTRFRASCSDSQKRGGRGGKVREIVFEVTPASRKTEGLQAARVSSHVYEQAYLARQSGNSDMPSSVAVGRAVTAHGVSDLILWSRWQDALERAKDSPSADIDGVEASVLLHVLSREGSDAAFTFWADIAFGKSKAPAPICEEEPAPVKGPAPEPKAPVEDRVPMREDFDDVQDYVRAADAFLARRRGPQPVDARTPREQDEDKVRGMARDITDLLDGKHPDKFVDVGWARNMCSRDYGWYLLDEPHMPPEARRAWKDIEAGLAVLRRMTLNPQADTSRRGPLRAIAGAVADWDLERAAVAARLVVAKAPPPEATRVPPPPPPRRSGWQPVSEAHAETGSGSYYGELAEAERQQEDGDYLAALAEPDYADDPLEE